MASAAGNGGNAGALPVTGVGLALSGGGSRAAAFHRGTIRGLLRLGLLPRVEVVSSVSGGSVAAAAWAKAGMAESQTREFLGAFKETLTRGFVWNALFSVETALAILPRRTLTQSMGAAFDRMFLHGMTLQQLPERPKVVLNVTVLNSGQVGKFSRDGFSTFGLGPQQESGSNPRLPMPGYPVALAAVASAAFPIGLKPINLRRAAWFPDAKLQGPLAGHEVLALSDGGIVENLGAQTLLRSRSTGTVDLVVSDAGTKFDSWRPGNPFEWVKNFALAGLSPTILARFAEVMSDKESRWMRETLIDDSVISRLVDEVEARGRVGHHVDAGLIERLMGLLESLRAVEGRQLLFIRLNQSPDHFASALPRWRLAQLAAAGAMTEGPTPTFVTLRKLILDPWRRDLLDEAVSSARSIPSHEALNAVSTGFTGLLAPVLDALDEQAYWQVLAAHAVFGEDSP